MLQGDGFIVEAFGYRMVRQVDRNTPWPHVLGYPLLCLHSNIAKFRTSLPRPDFLLALILALFLLLPEIGAIARKGVA